MKILTSLCASTLLLLASHANANLIVNGDFENPGIAAGTYQIVDTLPGWWLRPDVELRNALVGNAYTGSHYVELDTAGNSSIYQRFYTDAGTTYNLTFAYSPRIGELASTNGISVWADLVKLADITGTGGSDHEWTVYSYNFVATSGYTEISFSAEGTSDGLGGSLDTVSVNAVPVPASAALLALGLLGLRRRNRKN